MAKRQDKTEVIQTRVTPRDREAIQRAADAHGMSVSEFVRAAVLTTMVTQFDPHAWRALASGIANTVRDLAKPKRGLDRVIAGEKPGGLESLFDR